MNITRDIQNKKFVYYQNGKQILDKNVLERIRKLHIPPMWNDIKIANLDTDYLQSTAIDKKGRTQYIYHPIFNELNKIEKYDRIALFAKKLPLLINHVNKKLLSGNINDKEYIIALIIRILSKTHSRIGNDVYAEDNKTFGLTTLLKRHINISGDTITLSYIGKKSIKQKLIFTDAKSSKILKDLINLRGDRLFKTNDGQIIRSQDINDYIKNIMGDDFSAKDFRSYNSNDLFLKTLLKTKFCFFSFCSNKKKKFCLFIFYSMCVLLYIY